MMPTIQEPVTGREDIFDSFAPLAALSQFYRALNTRDIALMEQNWDASTEAVMDNPLGGIKRGWDEIRSVYESLFASPGHYWFEFYDYTLQRYGEVFIAIGRERGQLVSADGQVLELAIRTTRIFRSTNNRRRIGARPTDEERTDDRRTDDRWRQVHHHGSIDNPNMLARYQQAVLKRAA